MNIQCLKCKGRGFCGRTYCPHILKAESIFKAREYIRGSEFESQSPAPFVGRYGYPRVNVGILAPPERMENTWEFDAPSHWSKENFSIGRIVQLRSMLVNSRFRTDIRKESRFLEISREISMASRPVDIEVRLEDKPKFRLNTSADTAPHGPNAVLQDAGITSNPKISQKVDKTVSDTDLKANDALVYLYNNRFDENFLTRVLSVGNLGIKKNRRLVPTRWSITAVDDALGKNIWSSIRDRPSINDYAAYFGDYLGNYYLILMIPEIWSYELFETYMPKASWNTDDKVNYMTDYEPYAGRKRYADNCAGGYYSVRLAVLEKLKELKRQASCLVIRVITGDYSVPLGVWVTREAARKALAGRKITFASLDLMLRYATALAKKKFGLRLDSILGSSIMLKQLRTQKKLSGYF